MLSFFRLAIEVFEKVFFHYTLAGFILAPYLWTCQRQYTDSYRYWQHHFRGNSLMGTALSEFKGGV